MKVIRLLIRPFVVFVGGTASFVVLLFAIACMTCLLSIGLACAFFILWSLVHFAVYLTLHDRASGHAAAQCILMASMCFGFIVVTFRTAADLFNFARRKVR